MGTGTFLAQFGECVNIVLVLDQTWQLYAVYFFFQTLPSLCISALVKTEQTVWQPD